MVTDIRTDYAKFFMTTSNYMFPLLDFHFMISLFH